MTERKTYEAWSFTPLSLSPEEVMSHTLDAELESRIRSIISAEAPIKDTLLKKRLLSSLSLKRCGSRLDEYLSVVTEMASDRIGECIIGSYKPFTIPACCFGGFCHLLYFYLYFFLFLFQA